jgi:hypothetical protein
MLVLLLLSSQPLVFAAKFSLGDTVEVINTGASGLVVRDAPAGNAIGKKYDGNRGMVLAGPQSASLGGVVYTWWKVRWGDDALEGWSAEGYPGGVDYLKKIYVSPSTKFSIGDFVKVYNTGVYGLVVRTDPPTLSYIDIEVDGTFGKVEGGPFYGVAAGKAGFYHFWKVNYGSVVGWSAEDWLMKATPSDLTVEDIWIDPASFNPGSPVTFYTRIKNIGASAAVSDQGLWVRAYFDGSLCYEEGIEGLGAGYAYTPHWSYTWPSDSNWHTIEVRVDPANYIIESNEGNNIRSESFQAPPPNQAPTLNNGYVTPSSGDTSTTFEYYVTYTDPDGDAPVTKYVYVDGSPHTMTKIYGDYVSGATFKYSTTLSAGSHNYYFYFDDGHGHIVRLPTSGTYSGPNVSLPPEYRTLTVYSSPSGVTFTADGVSHTTPWSETYPKGTSVSLVMPSTHMVGEARYYWDRWSDGVTSRSRTVVMNTDITLTAYYTGPYYQLTVTSSPITGIPFTINGAPKTTAYSDWLLQGSYTIEMPQTYGEYTWSHWLEDGDTNRIKTFTLSSTKTLTAVYTTALPPNQPPVALFNYYPVEPKAGEEVTFDASASYDPDGAVVFYEWDWNGDGDYDSYTTSPTMTFWWMEDGNYQVRLRVTDDRGAVNITSKEITVSKSSTSETIIVLAGFWDYFKFWEWPQRWRDSRDLAEIDGWIREFEPNSNSLDWLKGTKFASCEKADLIYILNQEIDPVQAPGLTYKIYALNAIYEERLVHEAWLQPTPRYNYMLKPLIKYAFGSTWDLFISEQAIIALSPYLGIGVATIRMGLKVFSLRNLIEGIEQSSYTMGLGYYFTVRSIWPAEYAWSGEVESFVRSSIGASATEEEKQKILEDTRWYFEELWQRYEGEKYYEPGVTYGLPLELRQQYRNELKELLLSALEKHIDKLPNKRKVQIASPTELRVYDSEGRITGVINGEEKVEIPNSVYDSETKTATIFLPSDSLRYEVAGTGTGTYGIEITSIENGQIITFTATNIPTSANTIHQYTVDWTALSLGEEGVTVQVDSEGDGVFEHTFTSDSELTQSEFLAQTAYTFLIVWGEETFVVSVESNSTVSNFAFNQPDQEISFNVTGEAGTIGFCNVTIPKALLHGEPWTVLIDGVSVLPTITENATHSCLYFTYTHSTHEIQIIGTWVIPPPPLPLSVSISPLSASILVGQSVTFTSTVSGGYTPYNYQWYLNGNPVSGATSNTWTFTPTASGIYNVHLKVTDAKANTAQSETACITVATVTVETATGSGVATFSTDLGTIENLVAVSEAALPEAGKPNLTFPHGFFSFRIVGLTPGASVTVTITLPSSMPVGTQYWKYQTGKGWYQIPIGDDDGDNVITITLTDGGPGDGDGQANGVIVDPGGPGSPPPPPLPPPVGGVWVPINKFQLLAPWISLALLMGIAAASVIYVRHRKKQRN